MFASHQCEQEDDLTTNVNQFSNGSSNSLNEGASNEQSMRKRKKNASKYKHSNIISNLSQIDPIDHSLYSAGLDSSIVKWVPPRHHTRVLDRFSTEVQYNSNNSNNNSNNISTTTTTTADGDTSGGDDEDVLSTAPPDVYISIDKVRMSHKYNVCRFVDGNSMMITCEDNSMTLWSMGTAGEQQRINMKRLKSIVLSDMDTITCVNKLGKLIFLGSASGRLKIVEVVKDVTTGSIQFRTHTLVNNNSSSAPLIESATSMLWKLFNHRTHHHRGRIYGISIIGSSVKKYLLATCAADGFVKIWNVNDQRFSNLDYDPATDQSTENAYAPLYVVRLAILIQVVHPYIEASPVYQLENCTLDDGSFWHVRFWANDGHRRIVAWSCKIPQDSADTVDGGVEVSELRLFEHLGQFAICRVDNTDIRDGNGNFDLLLIGWNARHAKFEVFHLTPKPMEEKLMNKLCFYKHFIQSIRVTGTVFVKDCGIRAAKLISRDGHEYSNIIEANAFWSHHGHVEGLRLHYTRPTKRNPKSQYIKRDA
jgi:hypothetical protein